MQIDGRLVACAQRVGRAHDCGQGRSHQQWSVGGRVACWCRGSRVGGALRWLRHSSGERSERGWAGSLDDWFANVVTKHVDISVS